MTHPQGSLVSHRAQDLSLTLHIGLHKTGTSYLQSRWEARRAQMVRAGLLYPVTGTLPARTSATRAGAQSGHALFTRQVDRAALLDQLLREVPPGVSHVLISAEDFCLPDRMSPEQFLGPLASFGSVRVVVVLRRQDHWIESYYKQVVDQYHNAETRSFGAFLAEEGPGLLDFHARFAPWRDLVGPDRFHVISYDDVADGAEIGDRILRLAGLAAPLPSTDADRAERPYQSVRAIDTVGLRILNSYRIGNRDVRDRAARRIYGLAPAGDLQLMTPQMRAGIRMSCAPINERIEAQWCDRPVPKLRFEGESAPVPRPAEPGAVEMLEYVDRVIVACEEARREAAQAG